MSHHNLNAANGHLTDQGLERVLLAALSPRPFIRAASATTLRTAVTPSNAAPPPPNFNAAVRAAQAKTTATKGAFSQVAAPRPRHAASPDDRSAPPPPPDFNAAIRAARTK